MVHIWTGWDHITFVLCLCLRARGRRLIALITAFTIGLSLLFFNFGVEVGQLTFVVTMLIIITGLTKANWHITAKNIAAYSIVWLAVFWSLQRLTQIIQL